MSEYEGGYIAVRPKLWRGVIWTKDEKKVVWTCKHNHSRPEFNARYSEDPDQVWETSALNCGRRAYRQKTKNQDIVGDNGMVGDPEVPLNLRDDTKDVVVAGTVFRGTIRLNENGERILTVEAIHEGFYGGIYLNRPPKTRVSPPAVELPELKLWATAAWALQNTVWGLVFHDPRVDMKFDKAVPRAFEELFPDKKAKAPAKKARKKVPHIRQTTNEKGRRVFEVVDGSGDVVKTYVHRGKAAAELEKLQ